MYALVHNAKYGRISKQKAKSVYQKKLLYWDHNNEK